MNTAVNIDQIERYAPDLTGLHAWQSKASLARALGVGQVQLIKWHEACRDGSAAPHNIERKYQPTGDLWRVRPEYIWVNRAVILHALGRSPLGSLGYLWANNPQPTGYINEHGVHVAREDHPSEHRGYDWQYAIVDADYRPRIGVTQPKGVFLRVWPAMQCVVVYHDTYDDSREWIFWGGAYDRTREEAVEIGRRTVARLKRNFN